MLNETIKTYLEYKTAPYIVTIDGDWGAGKTRFVKDFIETHKDQFRFVYCPLNGVKSVEQVEKQIIVSYENFTVKTLNLLTNTAFEYLKQKYFVDFKRKNPFSKGVLSKTDITFKNELLKDFDHTVFVFDDIERYSGDFEELFGFILKFFELTEKKTILIGDFSRLKEKTKKIYDERIINKIIGLNLYLESDPEGGFDNFITLFKDNEAILKSHRDTIIEVFKQSKMHNLRSLKSALITINNFLNTLKGHNATILLENSTYLNDLIKYLTAYTIEKMQIGMGMFDKETLPEQRDKHTGFPIIQEGKLERALKKYGISKYITPPIKDSDIKMLFQGSFKSYETYLSEIKSHQKYFPKEKLWTKLYDFRELNDQEYDQALKSLYDEYSNYEITNPLDFLHSVAILLHLKSKGLMNEEISSSHAIKVYETLKQQENYTAMNIKKGGFHDASLGYMYYDYKKPEFQEVYQHVIEQDKENITTEYVDQFMKVFDNFCSSLNEDSLKPYLVYVDQKSPANFHDISLLSLVPNSFFDSIIELETHAFYTILRLIVSRTENQFNESEGYKTLLSKLETHLKEEASARKKLITTEVIQALSKKTRKNDCHNPAT